MKKQLAIAALLLCSASLLFGAPKKSKNKKDGNLKLGIWPEDTLTSEIKITPDREYQISFCL